MPTLQRLMRLLRYHRRSLSRAYARLARRCRAWCAGLSLRRRRQCGRPLAIPVDAPPVYDPRCSLTAWRRRMGSTRTLGRG